MRLTLIENFNLKELPGNSTISEILDCLDIKYKKYKTVFE